MTRPHQEEKLPTQASPSREALPQDAYQALMQAGNIFRGRAQLLRNDGTGEARRMAAVSEEQAAEIFAVLAKYECSQVAEG